MIGAGAAGLASIKELLAEGHAVTGFEQGAKPGGVWVYGDATDSDLLSASQSRRKVHGSMYRCAVVLFLGGCMTSKSLTVGVR